MEPHYKVWLCRIGVSLPGGGNPVCRPARLGRSWRRACESHDRAREEARTDGKASLVTELELAGAHVNGGSVRKPCLVYCQCSSVGGLGPSEPFGRDPMAQDVDRDAEAAGLKAGSLRTESWANTATRPQEWD